ncbi:MAG: FAD-binding oxidoreductase [Dehalococcoidia bacterium]
MASAPDERGRTRGILGPEVASTTAPTITAPRPRADLIAAVADTLTRKLGADQVQCDRDTLALMSRDFLRPSRAMQRGATESVLPFAIVRPRDSDDLAETLRIAQREHVPVVEFGGGTGLMGGARSVAPGIVLDMRSLNRILSISREDRTAHVQAGVVLAELGAALEPHGLIVGHDPWTYPIATVGGSISTNSLGYSGARYGSMGDQVLGLTVMLADGSIVRTRPMPRSSTGPHLRSLFIGAEGTLGIIIDATLKVFPQPEARKLVSYTFPGFDAGWQAIQALFALGITPAMVDFGQTHSGDLETARPLTPAGEPGLLHLAFEGLSEEVRAVARRTDAVVRDHGAVRLPLARARSFWQRRHVVASELRERQQRSAMSEDDWPGAGTLFDFVHVALPASRVLDFKRESEPLLTGRGISIGEWGLWNQPELFSLTVHCRVESIDDRVRFADGVDAVLRLAQDMGGSMEYCHGAGVRLAHLMEREHGTGMALLRGLKGTLDPIGLLNPGKLGL